MAYRDPEVGRARDLECYRRRTAERCALGLCPRCGERPPAPERSLCEPCAEKQRLAGRARDAKRRAAGRKRYRDLEKARAYERERSRRRIAERLAQGLCSICGHEPPMAEHRMCESCAVKRRAADRRRYAKAKASGQLYGGRDAEARWRIARAYRAQDI